MDLDAEFKLDEDLCYLNHAAVAPWPARSAEAVERFARQNAHRGAAHYPRWMAVEKQLRQNLAHLINAPSLSDIALVKSTSEALSFVAYGLDWQAGDEIVISDQEFPSNRIVWESLADQGVRVRVVSLDTEDCEAALIDAFNPSTRMLAISSVQYGTGLRLDLERLGRACREADVLFCVDSIQSLGAFPLDVQRAHIDFTMADGHKWLLGPEGLGVFYVRPNLRDQLKLTEFGWHMIEKRGDFSQEGWQVAEDATRFECGSPNSMGAHALEASTALLLEIGMDKVASLVLDRTETLEEELQKIRGIEILSSREAHRQSGILTFRVEGYDSQVLYQDLMARNVICASRGGGVRFSPHCYTSDAVIERAVERVAECLR
ncbi:aminotransferase class V-fold PLP-dependent enzyme [Marinobacter nanhaiticus D15-8W]|uniref:Aminotransferase class V-fold PLP-dependent enzyme n=1 Tax=Marinobacter nanhaiticus D15-8W TaxID=626887 RepID=N6W1B1_9GAMM|nr:aminotransferase class V-fold PLP-dependent enzyme [Marinobacter nanhaiticus]ENO13899.1 aminotransferase class V-fold PLP-dependent enzyme [Marinobacter nanhaiticus D15-8W]BES71276.1 aminotransferase class V-fold PLP-dependent enzyme [Marinobacter nanhaiticus D15-8W]